MSTSLFNGQYFTDRKVIGRGNFSTVYTGTVAESGIPVAIKEIDMSEFDEVHLRRELENMQKAKHENIVRIYHAFIENGNAYLILELCQGGTLFTRLKAVQHFSESKAANIIVPILHAIHYLHSQNIIHRDIKAGNIFFYDTTPESRVLLGDFGFSKQVNDQDDATSYAGTPEYMAPEVLCAFDGENDPYDRKCDIWSIGILVFQMITGYVPFKTSAIQNCLQKMYASEYVYPPKLGSESVRDFIRLCLQPDPSFRPEACELLEHRWIKEYTE